MEKKDEIINIGCASNDAYIAYLGPMLFSLLKNCSCPEKVNIYLADGGISNKNKNKLKEVIKKFKSSLYFLNPDKNLIKGLKMYRHLGIEAYYRFSLIERLDLKKILYLDCDLIIEDDILKLYQTELDEKIFGAIRDLGVSESQKNKYGISKENPYLNSGVMLIDLKKWKDNKLTYKIINYLKENYEKIEFADQDAINAVLKNDWKEFDLSWNFMPKIYYYRFNPFTNKDYRYKKKEFNQIKKPKIIHFASILKPWYKIDIIPFKKRYWFYVKKSPWEDLQYADKNIKGKLKRIKDYWGFIFNNLKSK